MCRGGGGSLVQSLLPTHVQPTYKMDPKQMVYRTMLHNAPLNGVTPTKHNPKWHILIVMALKMIRCIPKMQRF